MLTILAARGVRIGPADRMRILAERDLSRLDRWTARAAICATVGKLFAKR